MLQINKTNSRHNNYTATKYILNRPPRLTVIPVVIVIWRSSSPIRFYRVVVWPVYLIPLYLFLSLLLVEQFLLWPFQRFSKSKGYHLLKARGQYYPLTDSAAVPKSSSSADKMREFKVQHRQLIRDQVRQSPQLTSSRNDKPQPPLHDDDGGDYDEAEPETTNLWRERIKAADNQDNGAPNRPRLDLRLGQKINDLFDASTKAVVLGHGTSKNVKFEWMITPWSECSQPCGTGIGFRVRIFYCSSGPHRIKMTHNNIVLFWAATLSMCFHSDKEIRSILVPFHSSDPSIVWCVWTMPARVWRMCSARTRAWSCRTQLKSVAAAIVRNGAPKTGSRASRPSARAGTRPFSVAPCSAIRTVARSWTENAIERRDLSRSANATARNAKVFGEWTRGAR